MNKAEKLYRQFIKDWAPIHHKALTKSEYNDLVILFESHLNAMRDEYAQQEYERGFKDGKEIAKEWEDLRDSGLDKKWINQTPK